MPAQEKQVLTVGGVFDFDRRFVAGLHLVQQPKKVGERLIDENLELRVAIEENHEPTVKAGEFADVLLLLVTAANVAGVSPNGLSERSYGSLQETDVLHLSRQPYELLGMIEEGVEDVVLALGNGGLSERHVCLVHEAVVALATEQNISLTEALFGKMRRNADPERGKYRQAAVFALTGGSRSTTVDDMRRVGALWTGDDTSFFNHEAILFKK